MASDPTNGSGDADSVPGGGGPTPTAGGPTVTVDLLVSEKEALFASSTIRMFGRIFTGLTLGDLGVGPGSNQQLASFLRHNAKQPREDQVPYNLARIYGIVYQGEYYKMPDPPVMLVFGPGQKVPPGLNNTVTLGGFDYSTGTFTDEVLMWTVDALDSGVRIDVSVGWISEILLTDAMGYDCDDAVDPGMGGRALQSKAASKMTSKAASKLASKLVQR